MKVGGAPDVDMPWRVETFLTHGNKTVYQGRLFSGQGSHYWGSSVPEEQ